MERNGRQSNPAAFIDYTLQVGDFGDAVNWPTPGEIAHKSVQVSVRREGLAGSGILYTNFVQEP